MTISAYIIESKVKKIVDNVLDYIFWKECVVIVQVTKPLVRVLSIVDSNDRLAMSYLYATIYP